MAEEPDLGYPRRSRVDEPPSWLGEQQEEPRACAFCGELPPPASSFCPKCGRALTAAILPQQGQAATVLFTDIEDSTELTDRLGDAVWASILDEHNEIVREALHHYAGFEVKLTGDGFLIVFADSMQALRCAARVQADVTRLEQRRGTAWPVSVRMGVHRGDVILRPGGDILGRTVNMAARVMDTGRGGQVMASEQLVEHVSRQVSADYWEDAGARRLKGLEGRNQARHRIYRFLWRDFLQPEPGYAAPTEPPLIEISQEDSREFDPIPREFASASAEG